MLAFVQHNFNKILFLILWCIIAIFFAILAWQTNKAKKSMKEINVDKIGALTIDGRHVFFPDLINTLKILRDMFIDTSKIAFWGFIFSCVAAFISLINIYI